MICLHAIAHASKYKCNSNDLTKTSLVGHAPMPASPSCLTIMKTCQTIFAWSDTTSEQFKIVSVQYFTSATFHDTHN